MYPKRSMDSICLRCYRTVRVDRDGDANLDDAEKEHACSLEDLIRVTDERSLAAGAGRTALTNQMKIVST
jgi:hypothetical protein